MWSVGFKNGKESDGLSARFLSVLDFILLLTYGVGETFSYLMYEAHLFERHVLNVFCFILEGDCPFLSLARERLLCVVTLRFSITGKKSSRIF